MHCADRATVAAVTVAEVASVEAIPTAALETAADKHREDAGATILVLTLATAARMPVLFAVHATMVVAAEAEAAVAAVASSVAVVETTTVVQAIVVVRHQEAVTAIIPVPVLETAALTHASSAALAKTTCFVSHREALHVYCRGSNNP